MRPWRIGTRSCTRVLSCFVRVSTGSWRSGGGSQPAWLERGAFRRAALPAAWLSLAVAGSDMRGVTQQPMLARLVDRLRSRRSIELAVDGLGLSLDGVRGHEALLGDLAEGEMAGQELEGPELGRCEHRASIPFGSAR